MNKIEPEVQLHGTDDRCQRGGVWGALDESR